MLGHLSPSSALTHFLTSLPQLFPDCHACFSLLLHLLPPSAPEAMPPADSNLLFDPDPVNDYAEELVVMRGVAAALSVLMARLVETGGVSEQHYLELSVHTPAESEGVGWWEGSGALGSWWEGSGELLNRRKAELLRPLLSTISKAVGRCGLEGLIKEVTV